MTYLISYNNATYEIELIRKKGLRYIHYSLPNESNYIRVTIPYHAPNDYVLSITKKRLPGLVKLAEKENSAKKIESFYFLGEKKEETIDLSQIKPQCLDIIKSRVDYYFNLMGVDKPYKVKIRDMKTRLGTNSRRTYTLDFALCLFRYPLEVIDAIVIHELAHHFYFDHSKKFYEVVYRYMDKQTYKYYLKLIRDKKYDRSYILERK